MSDWAAKVLADVPRHSLDFCDQMEIDKDGVWMHVDDAIAAIDKLGDAYAKYMGSVMTNAEEMAQQMRAHIAALTAQLAEKEEQLVSVLRREAATHERHDAKVARLEGAQRRIRKLPDHIEEQVKVTRDYAADCGMNPSQITLMDICTSHFLDMARELRAAITDGGNDG